MCRIIKVNINKKVWRIDNINILGKVKFIISVVSEIKGLWYCYKSCGLKSLYFYLLGI